jgi:hypothetical protein
MLPIMNCNMSRNIAISKTSLVTELILQLRSMWERGIISYSTNNTLVLSTQHTFSFFFRPILYTWRNIKKNYSVFFQSSLSVFFSKQL